MCFEIKEVVELLQNSEIGQTKILVLPLFRSSAHLFTMLQVCTDNSEFNDLRIMICWRNFEDTVERISVCNVIEKLMEHGIHCLSCSFTIDMLLWQL